MTQPQIYLHTSLSAQTQSLAAQITKALVQDMAARDRAFLILPGGSSPCALISELAERTLDWDKIDVTVTDERCVPLDSLESNAGQITRLCAAQSLTLAPFDLASGPLDHLPWPASITVLGMGLDAHIASLFPDQDYSKADGKMIRTTAPNPPRARISLTMDALLETQKLILLVNSAEKWRLCQRISQGELANTPLAQIIKMAGDLLEIHVVE